jgi:hypothetical protein
MKEKAITLCQLKSSCNTRLTVKGNLRHNGDTILVVVPTSRKLNVGDEITIYNVSGTHTGTFFVKVDDGGMGYVFDSSTLLTDGKLRVTSITKIQATAISADDVVDIYNSNGICLCKQKQYAEALSTLHPGTYVVVRGRETFKITINQ